jgi:hypothetical protein
MKDKLIPLLIKGSELLTGSPADIRKNWYANRFVTQKRVEIAENKNKYYLVVAQSEFDVGGCINKKFV